MGLRLLLSPDRETLVSCEECKKWYAVSPTSKRPRLESEKSPEFMGCKGCDLEGSEGYEYMPRIEIILQQYFTCCGPNGNRTTWPFDSAPMRNPRFVRECFGIIDAKILDKRSVITNGDDSL